VDRDFAKEIALRLRKGERAFIKAKSAADAIRSGEQRSVKGLSALTAVVRGLVSPDLVSAATSLSQFAKMAGDLEPTLAFAQEAGWEVWRESSPGSAAAFIKFSADFAKARDLAMASAKSDDEALAVLENIVSAVPTMQA
jgi:hypothetical protein